MNKYFKQLEIHNTNIFMLSIICIRIMGMLSISIFAEFINISNEAGLVITQIVFLLIPSILYIFFTKKSFSSVGITAHFNMATLLVVLLISIFVQPIMSFFSVLSGLFFPNEITQTVGALETGGALTFVIVAFLPAICEEIVMRGIFFSGYVNSGIKITTVVVINGLFFGMLHMDLQQFLYAFVAGVIFSYIVYFSRSAIYAIIAHFVINSTQLILFRMLTSTDVPQASAETSSFTQSFIVLSVGAIICVPILLFLFHILKKINTPKPFEPEDGLNLKIEDMSDEMESPKIADFPFGITILIYLLFIMLIYFL